MPVVLHSFWKILNSKWTSAHLWKSQNANTKRNNVITSTWRLYYDIYAVEATYSADHGLFLDPNWKNKVK